VPRAIVIRAPGTNCEQEMLRGFELAGAKAELHHLDALIREPSRLDPFDLIGFPGGFSYGDDIASGRIFAMKLRRGLYPALRAALDRGCLMIGACNGFQTMVQAGLLPGPGPGEPWPEEPPAQSVALTANSSGRFRDCWVPVTYNASSRCVWTRGLQDLYRDEADAALMLPVAHGEGRFSAPPEVIRSLVDSGRVAVSYGDNFNGSAESIAGICDASGRVFALMPHPERFLEWNRHPAWTRLPERLRALPTPGTVIFRNAVEAAAGVAGR